jgi:hypothetical protein
MYDALRVVVLQRTKLIVVRGDNLLYSSKLAVQIRLVSRRFEYPRTGPRRKLKAYES